MCRIQWYHIGPPSPRATPNRVSGPRFRSAAAQPFTLASRHASAASCYWLAVCPIEMQRNVWHLCHVRVSHLLVSSCYNYCIGLAYPRLRNDLLCVEWDVIRHSVHSLTHAHVRRRCCKKSLSPWQVSQTLLAGHTMPGSNRFSGTTDQAHPFGGQSPSPTLH